MITLTLRYIKGDFVVTGPDIEPTRFKTRREAKDCHASVSIRSRVRRSPRSATVLHSPKAATSAPGSDWCQSRYRRETVPSSARYPGAAIAICALCSCRQPGSYWSGSGQSIGTAMGSSPGSRLPKNVCTTMCWRSRSPTSLPASPGRFSTRSANSSASGQTRCRPELLECRAVLGPVKAWPGDAGARGKANATASLDGPLRVARQHMRRPGRRNGLQARTKELHKDKERSMT